MPARRTTTRRGSAKRRTSKSTQVAASPEAANGSVTGAPKEAPAPTTSTPSTSRTVSVSPHRPSNGQRNKTMATTDVVLTPRVLDQRAFDELSETLQHLISQSQDLTSELAHQVEAASTLDTQATRASTRLQDRLHLSARMLKALQVQIDKLQNLQDEFTERSNESQKAHKKQLDAMDAHRSKLAGQLSDLSSQISDAMRSKERDSAAAIDAKVADSAKRISETDEKLAGLNDTVSKLTDLVVQSEKSITSVAYRAAQSAQRAEHVVEDAKRTLRQCEEARQQLGRDLMEAEERLAESAKRSDELTAKVQNALGRCEAAERQFGRIMEAAGPFVEQLERLEKAVTDSNALLPQLAPWEPILLKARNDPQSLPAPLRELVDLVRAGLRGEMQQLAGSMHGLANRMEVMSANGLAGAATSEQRDHSVEVDLGERATEIVTLPGASLASLASRSSAPLARSVVATANGTSKSDE